MVGNNDFDNEIIKWGSQYLLSHGYLLKSNLPEIIQNTPWSYVVRFATSDGYIYLKHTPELLALEATIIQVLHNQFHAHVPKIIEHNVELDCFLMKDAGKSLRVILKQKFDESLLCKAIDQFTSLQIAVSDHVDAFLNIGVPDWRLNKLPDLYKQLLSQKDMLIEDGLSAIEISKLEALFPTIFNLCKKLSAYSVKPSIVQPDFNDNNSCIDETLQEITLIDLGEIAISHPFFSLINFLHVIKKYHALTDENETYLLIKDACLKNFMKFEPSTSDAFEIARILFFIYGALANYRLMMACGKSKLISSFQRHGRPSMLLKELITVMGCD
ncbi:MAG: aminoglycoside phosphotransferase family protein [Gammaproteobacteria bacterium]|nr:aminoglycoside phosphotransferase family protein [Gammaproteobacteria bacterium]MCW5583354.1 aminoglycoside phosphotransferase family protein [Gammaproteobacteria bacterium]